MTEFRFLEPLDVLYLRGNKLFGDAGAHGAALMPPWPSLVAGALRSRMLVDAGMHPNDFAAGKTPVGALTDSLGTATKPGAFRVALFTVAQRRGSGDIECMFPLPADVVVHAHNHQQDRCTYLQPMRLPEGLASSFPLSRPAVLRVGELAKPETGRWLNQAGWAAYLRGAPLMADHLVKTEKMWGTDPRLGIALDASARTAAQGQIYTTEAIAFQPRTGFLVGVAGAGTELPSDGLVRLGGDGRAAALQACRPNLPESPWDTIAASGRFRLILATPGLFPTGWRLPGLSGDRWQWSDSAARLVSAAIPRAAVVSGWDLVGQQPKPAQRAVPAGSVYWLEELDNIEGLRSLIDTGLWSLLPTEQYDANRRAEGFNNVFIAAWPTDIA